jgi:hypothetical protein
MKKILFTLGALTAICACSLVIDPDKLVEGNGAGPGPSDEAGTDGASVEVPECVPAIPAGTMGPYALASAQAPADAVCPTGYRATPVASGKGNLGAEDIACESTAGCCNPSGSVTCGLVAKYFDDSNCGSESGTATNATATCADLAITKSHIKLELVSPGITCSPAGAGTVSPTKKPAPAYATSYVVCAPDPSAKTAVCKDGFVAMPGAKDAAACVLVSAGGGCPAPYTTGRDVSKSGAFKDDRTCTCACGVTTPLCTGGKATIYPQFSCGGSPLALTRGQCTPIAGYDSIDGVLPTPVASACTATATPSGAITPDIDLHLCCLE